MPAFAYADAATPIRDDLAAAHRAYWDELARPGAWWSGVARVAIAQQVRAAWSCSLCAARKQALSPAMVEGEHEPAGALAAPVVDAIHRITTDASRLSKGWFDGVLAAGLDDASYVEMVGVVTSVVSIDAFHDALALPREPLPEPVPGAPSRLRPSTAVQGPAWVPWIPGDRAAGAEADLYPAASRTAHVYMALSLVPDAVRAMGRLSQAHYVGLALVASPGACEPGRALDRTQMELIAGRVSARNECFY